MGYLNVTYFAMTVYPMIIVLRWGGSTPPSPGGTPPSPRGNTLMFCPLLQPRAQKEGTKSFTPTSVKHWHIDPVYIAQRTLIVNHSGIFDTPSIENIHTLCIINNTNSSLMPSTVASIHKVSLLQLSDRVNNGLY